MSLRLRLILVILVVVASSAIASFVSFYVNLGVQRQVAQLSRMSLVGLDEKSVVGQPLEITGYWDKQGYFIATDIEKLIRSRRPKLRGELEKIDRKKKKLTLFGRRIEVDDDTKFLAPENTAESFESLMPGQRVEVSCKVDDDDGDWIARKIRTQAVKKSDKVKGIISKATMDPASRHRLDIEGLTILVDPGMAINDPRSQLYLMQNATQLTVAVRECLAAAYQVIKEASREADLLQSGDVTGAAQVTPLVKQAKNRVRDAYEDFVHFLSESRSAVKEANPSTRGKDRSAESLAAAESEKITLWFDPLEAKRCVFEENVARFLELSDQDLMETLTFFKETLQPHLEDDILPLVQDYHLETEEDLSDALQAVSIRSATAASLAIAINVVGLVVALALGLFLSRSISRPILALKSAARELGQGNLEMRVDVRSRDEIGILAATFNRMAEELAASTVSVSNLNNVIDSMAGALLILAPDETIRSVNPAALNLLGYGAGELVGRPFATICPNGDVSAVQPSEGGIVSVAEKVFCKKNGSTLPVSFSGTALRDDVGSVRGFVCVAQDLTKHKQMEAELRRSLSDKEMLLREVHHRVKNNLQVITSLLDLQSRTLTDPMTKEKFRQSQDRVRSMVFIHEQLYRTRDLDRIDFHAYLERLTAYLAQSYGTAAGQIRLQVLAEDLNLDIDRALACGLIVNELVTNAFKHAFSEDNTGEILVSARYAAEGDCVLEVSDNGRGLDDGIDPGTTMSLGLSLVNAEVKQLRGRLQLVSREPGTTVRIEFPLKSHQEV